MPFQTGNTEWAKGQKVKPFRDALRMEAAALANGEKIAHPPGSLRWNAQALLTKGDVSSIITLSDRLDGRPPQAIIGDDESSPVRIEEVRRVIVKAAIDAGNQDSGSIPAATIPGPV